MKKMNKDERKRKERKLITGIFGIIKIKKIDLVSTKTTRELLIKKQGAVGHCKCHRNSGTSRSFSYIYIL